MRARFVRLGIAGFKSFAEPASLEIMPGLTGIVGPNGCGKSNVAEALRWAMGEGNARSLRGGEMDDIIFAGTTARPSRNLAEVVLTLEAGEAEGGFPGAYAGQPEVTVARRIERGAGSFYRVNGRETRARDVQTLFADLASGARSSAMVSQGRVSALVAARPEERRLVLEEAAGITGLHARRAEAETKLRAAETNLERAEERRGLLEQQLAGLRTQAKQAARYRTLATAVEDAEAALLALQVARVQAARAAAEAALAEARAAATEAAQRYSAAEREAVAASEALPALRAREAGARTALERARLAQDGVESAIASARAALQAAAQRRSQIAHDLAYAEQVQRDAAGADARLVAEAERLEREERDDPPLLEAAREKAAAATDALQAAEAAANRASERAAELAALAQAADQVLASAEARHRRASESLARLQAERDRAALALPDPARVAAAREADEAAGIDLAQAREQAEAHEAARAASGPRAAAAREAFARAEAARARLAAEVSALAEVLAVRDGERWAPMGDRLQVPPGLELALGAALGVELAAALDPAAARHWRELPAVAEAELPGERLTGLVQGPPAFARALSGIGVVASEQEGDAGQGGLLPGQTLVSREGGVWRWDGYTVRAGTPTEAAVRLQQRNRLAGLRRSLAQAETEAQSARRERDAADTGEREAVAAEQRARAARREAETRAERARTEAAALTARAEQAQALVAGLDERIAALMPERDEAQAALEAAKREREAAPDLTLLRAEAERARAALAAARSVDREAQRGLEAIERDAAARAARRATIGREREDRRMRAADAAARVTDLAARAEAAAREEDALRSGPDAAARQAETTAVALREALAAHQEAAQSLAEGERHASATAAAARVAEQAAYAGREAIVRAEGAVEQAEQGWAAVQERVAERSGALTLPPPPADLSLAAEDRARNKWQRLARERDEMGPVNLRAEIEAAALETEIATIASEREELGTAIAKLRGGIGHINREGRERLSAVFQEVDRHFQSLFTRMFGGGRAHLALVGSDDPLQAGLEIYAQPPGKKLATLSLLSGGEQALTALSLIFAVFRCNPAPLCVLDEVDAPLDDANVERFCNLLADMVAETGTRFLVVTHHHLTMARMDRLYGVTMQERGVSRLLSVDLGRAVEMVEAVAAE